MLNINFKKVYRKRDGSKGFIYSVNGTEQELAAYVAAKVKSGMPESAITGTDGIVSFEREYVGTSAPLVISEKGNYYPDTTSHDIMISNQRQIQGVSNLTAPTKIATEEVVVEEVVEAAPAKTATKAK